MKVNEASSSAELYHRLTSYEVGRSWLTPVADWRIRQDFTPLRADLRPASVKRYPPELPRVSLDVGRSHADKLLDDLADVLRHSLGVPPGARGRAASSAGNRHPVDAYLHTAAGPGLAAGVWYYDADQHGLVRVAEAPAASGRTLVLSALPWRTQWRYAERGYRHVWWDTGTVLSHLLLLAQERGLRPVLRLSFPDRRIADLVGADLVTEMPVALVGLTGPPDLAEVSAPAEPGQPEPGAAIFPLVTDTHATGCRHDPWIEPDAVIAPTALDQLGRPLTEIIAARRTTRTFATGNPLGVEEMLGLLDAVDSLSPPTVAAHTVSTHVLVHDVQRAGAGLYEWTGGELRLRQPGRFRALARRLCLDQPVGGECAFLIVLSCRLPQVIEEFGERGYRAVQVRAGLRVGAVYLAATAYGLGCSALTLCDPVLPELLGRPDAAALLACAVGVPD